MVNMTTDPQVRQLAEQDEKLFADWAEKQYPGMSYDSTEEVAIRYAHYFASHTRREALREAEQAVVAEQNEWTTGKRSNVAVWDACDNIRAATRLLAEEKNGGIAMPSENCVRCNIPLVRAVEKKLCCNCEDHGLSAEGWNHLQFASRECECQLCEQLASRFRIVAGPNDEPDFCVCDYRPRRKCSVHPESSNASQVEAIFQEVEKKLLSGELSETWPEIRKWLSAYYTQLRPAGSLRPMRTVFYENRQSQLGTEANTMTPKPRRKTEKWAIEATVTFTGTQASADRAYESLRKWAKRYQRMRVAVQCDSEGPENSYRITRWR